MLRATSSMCSSSKQYFTSLLMTAVILLFGPLPFATPRTAISRSVIRLREAARKMAENDVGVLPVAENDQSMIRVGDVNLARHYVADLHSRFSFQICRRLPPVKTRLR